VLEEANLNLSQSYPNLSGSTRIDKIIEGQIEPTVLQQPVREYFSFFQDLSYHLSRERPRADLKTRRSFISKQCETIQNTLQRQHRVRDRSGRMACTSPKPLLFH
jgi:hypothetical protein